MRYLHNRALHGWGIAEGFDVRIVGPRQIEIGPGVAIDREGREIVLEQSLLIEIGAPELTGDDTSCFVTASWEQVPDEQIPDERGAFDHGRWLEEPVVGVAAEAPPDPGRELFLARLMTHGGDICEVDASARRPLAKDRDGRPSEEG
jgi:hypothetical protein